MALAPMAVLPDHQRKGVGADLISVGLKELMRLGTDAVVVLGHPDYYPKQGFVQASRFNISCEFDAPDEAYMIKELFPGALKGTEGVIEYPAAFKTV